MASPVWDGSALVSPEGSLESFTTPRLRAERIRVEHLPAVRILHRDPKVMKTLSADGQVLPDAATEGGLVRQSEHWDRHGFGLWVFRRREDGRFAGRGGLMRYEIEGRPEIGLGYAVVSELWGLGFATEIAAASIGLGFTRLGFSEIASWTLPHNHASRRVMEKLGFVYERDFLFAGLPHLLYRLRPSGLSDTEGHG